MKQWLHHALMPASMHICMHAFAPMHMQTPFLDPCISGGQPGPRLYNLKIVFCRNMSCNCKCIFSSATLFPVYSQGQRALITVLQTKGFNSQSADSLWTAWYIDQLLAQIEQLCDGDITRCRASSPRFSMCSKHIRAKAEGMVKAQTWQREGKQTAAQPEQADANLQVHLWLASPFKAAQRVQCTSSMSRMLQKR